MFMTEYVPSYIEMVPGDVTLLVSLEGHLLEVRRHGCSLSRQACSQLFVKQGVLLCSPRGSAVTLNLKLRKPLL